VADGKGTGDLANAGLLLVGAEEGAGDWPKTAPTQNIKTAVAATELNIV
jgi:hypothetical protein